MAHSDDCGWISGRGDDAMVCDCGHNAMSKELTRLRSLLSEAEGALEKIANRECCTCAPHSEKHYENCPIPIADKAFLSISKMKEGR